MEKQSQFENVLRCKWSSSVLMQIAAGIKQPGELLRSISGLTKKVLYQRLKKLERFEYIQRRLVTEKPLKVFYTLTTEGRKVVKILKMVKSL